MDMDRREENEQRVITMDMIKLKQHEWIELILWNWGFVVLIEKCKLESLGKWEEEWKGMLWKMREIEIELEWRKIGHGLSGNFNLDFWPQNFDYVDYHLWLKDLCMYVCM